MTGSASRPKWRYVGFHVHPEQGPPPDRRAMVEVLDRAFREARLEDRKRLTVFTGTVGIARCERSELDTMRRALASIDRVDGRPARVETVVTSGTIKKVKAHLGLDQRV